MSKFNTEEQNHYTLVLSQRKIQEFIIGAVQLKLNHGLSISTTEDCLQHTASLLGNKLIPTKWNDVICFLKSLGYVEPRHYKVCAARDHSYLLKLGENECKVCHKQAADCVDYYVLGLNFRDWFLTTNQCDRLMAHWTERDHWLNKDEDYQHPGQSELWHGERFRSLSWFWDSDKHYILPDWCPFCRTVISSSKIQTAFEHKEPITCPECAESFPAVPRRITGDPRNQVVLIHEDGWNCFSISQSSMAAITITHGWMSKADRSNADYARVYSFVPTDQMPTDSPHKFDAFLESLINELEELFIEGEEVFFRKAISGVCDENACSTLRVLPLLLTADSKAHHEIGLTSSGGHKGCQRCQVCGTYVPERRHYYFGNFQMRFWIPCLARTADEDRINGKAADRATSATERKQICKEKGVTGESILYRLNDLCGFDPIQDLTIDAMHAITLNLVRTDLAHILADLGPNSSLEPTERDPANGGLVNRQSLASAIQKVEWTPELKDGRVPTFCKDAQTLSYWKAEEFSKFILVAHVVLRKLISRSAYECFCTLKDICDLVYSKRLRIQGWHRESMTNTSKSYFGSMRFSLKISMVCLPAQRTLSTHST